MDKYRSLDAWKHARAVSIGVLKTTDAAYHPRTIALFNQLRRASISIEANIVEGYALGTTAQFVRHLRIALGSAAETQAMLEVAAAMGYLQEDDGRELATIVDRTMGCLVGLIRARQRSKSM